MKILDVPQSGSVAGVTSSRNRFGQYRRTRAIPVQPRTSAQLAVRTRFTAFATIWKTLTGPQQDAWQGWSDLHPRRDSLGQSYVMTGFQAMVSVNMVLLQSGLAPDFNAPGSEVTFDAGVVSDITSAAGAISMAFSPPTGDDTDNIFASPPVSPGVNFNGDYRFIGLAEDGDTSPLDITSMYTAKFGTYPVGYVVFFRVYQQKAGQLNNPQEFRVLLA